MDWALIFSAFWQAFAAGFGRNVVGWFTSSIAQGSDLGEAISNYEWRLGAQTLFVTIISALIIAFALAGLFPNGTSISETTISIIAGLIVNEIWRAFQKKKATKKK